MQLVGTPLSHFTRKVRIVAAELAIPLDFQTLPATTGVMTGTPDAYANNPLMRVPILVDGETRILESDHIVRYLVGRFDPSTGVHPDVDLTAEDHNLSVSRRHARILCEHGRYFLLEEPGVANGTYVKGDRVQPGDARELQPGDRVGFGMVVLFFEKG